MIRPFPGLYKQFKKVGNVSKAGRRYQVEFPSLDGEYSLFFAETDANEAFVWLMQNNEVGGPSRMEFRQFKKYGKALQYIKDRYGVNLSGLKTAQIDNPNLSKYYLKK